MGRYINKTSKHQALPAKGKIVHLVEDGARIIPEPETFKDNLVCVVDNGFFEAAGYAYSENEMKVFKRDDGRPKTWLVYPKVNEMADG